MTPSEKSESSGAQSGQQDPTPVSTQTVGNVENAGSASATAETSSASSSGGGGAEETASTGPASTEAAPGHGEATEPPEVPPPWQRAAVATGNTGTAGTQGEQHSSPADTADTQRIPKPNQDQDTVRTGVPTVASSGGQGTAVGGTAAGFGGPGAATGSASAGNTSAPEAGNTGGGASVSFPGSGSRSGTASGSPGSNRRPSRGPRRASLQVKRVDPWSVLKLALVLNIALFFVWMISVAVLYGVLDGMGTWDMLNGTFTEMTQPDTAASEPLISAGRVFGWSAIIGGVNIVLITALATVGAFIYNVAADFAGGLELTLSERE